MISLDLALRYGLDGSVALRGSRSVLKSLVRVLRSGQTAVVTVPVPPIPPGPYQGWMNEIVIRPETGRELLVVRSQTQLVLTGAQRSLEILAQNVDQLADALGEDGAHTHIEYYPGHYYLQEGSIPLVISIA